MRHSPTGSNGPAADGTSTPPCSRSTTRTRSTRERIDPAGDPESLAELRERAVHWLVRASELAVRRYELEDAIAMLHRALELDADGARALELWRRIGRAHALRHDGDAFLEALMNAIPLSPDRATEAELYADLSIETAMRTGMWRRRPGASSWTAGSTGRWSSPSRTAPPEPGR